MHTHTHFLFFFYPQEVPCIINLIFQSKTPLSLHCCFCLSLYLQQVSRHPCLQPGYWTGPWHINAAHSPLYNSEVSFQLSTNYILQWKWKVKKKKGLLIWDHPLLMVGTSRHHLPKSRDGSGGLKLHLVIHFLSCYEGNIVGLL